MCWRGRVTAYAEERKEDLKRGTKNLAADLSSSQFFAAQMKGFEKTTGGWTFWSWKTTLGDYRWTYKGELDTYPPA